MKPEILVVDDEPDIRAMVRLNLEDEGYAVREAEMPKLRAMNSRANRHHW